MIKNMIYSNKVSFIGLLQNFTPTFFIYKVLYGISSLLFPKWIHLKDMLWTLENGSAFLVEAFLHSLITGRSKLPL